MPGFEVTALGHQGWLFATEQSRVLVNPLLTESFGHRGEIGVVHPPRVFDFGAMAPIDAVFLTHEHEDHFDLPSLARLDRRIPVCLSDRSSVAARTLLAEMGFRVVRVGPGDIVTVGDLDIHLFAPDLSDVAAVGDEWDVLPFLVVDRRGHGSFYSAVDVVEHPETERALRRIVDVPGLWSFANNAGNWTFANAGRVEETERRDTPWFTQQILRLWSGVSSRWKEPVAVLLCGGGMAFTGEREWLNRHVFRADSERACEALSVLAPGRPFLKPAPGRTVSMVGGALADIDGACGFLRTPPREQWPSREYVGDVELMETYAPATERRELSPAELDELHRGLRDLAASICGTPLFRGLLSLGELQLRGRRPTFSLVLLCDDRGGSYAFEYDASACAFVKAKGDPVLDYAGGIEMWASDLLALFQARIGPMAIAFGRSRAWSHFPEHVVVNVEPLWMYNHPLRRPDHYLAFYRRLLRETAADAPVCVRAGERHDVVVRPRDLPPEPEAEVR